MLGPVLREQCGGRLSEVSWFRSDWQRGGAATGYATYTGDDSAEHEVVVKLPVGPVEHRFSVALSRTDAPTPRVLADGDAVGGYDLAWLVLERLPGGPLPPEVGKAGLQELAEAAARLQQRACECEPPGKPHAEPDWEALLGRARETVKQSNLQSAGQWNDLIHKLQRALPRILPAWTGRAINTWRHGDLHPGNAMRREDGSCFGPAGCVLIDLGEMRPGHWVEDAVYLEHLYWRKPELLEGAKCVSLLARARKALGLDTSDDYPALANIRRVLYAASAPATLLQDGSGAHLAAAQATLERLLPVVTK